MHGLKPFEWLFRNTLRLRGKSPDVAEYANRDSKQGASSQPDQIDHSTDCSDGGSTVDRGHTCDVAAPDQSEARTGASAHAL